MSRMVDLCIDARMAFSSGIGTYIRELVPLLDRGRFKVTLLVSRLGDEWCKGFQEILFEAPIYSIKEQVLYPIKIPPSDLFWSPHYNIPVLPIRAKKRVATLHDACHMVLGSALEKIYAKWFFRSALLKSNQTLTVSWFSKSEIERLLGKNHMEVISIGVNRNRFTRQAPSDEVRRKYRLPSRFVLYVGNHKPHKNLEGLVRAFHKVNIRGLELVLVGKGTRVGLVDEIDLPTLYSMAEAFVFPSFYEGFGLPPLEAMSCGCPTVVSNAASLPEVCGDASLYFNPANPEEMAKAIQKAIENPQPLIEKGYERVKQFNWKETAERHMRLFEEVCHA